LEDNGDEQWSIRVAYSAQEALTRLHERVDVLIADIVMPGIDGFALSAKVMEYWPLSKVIYLTGNPKIDYAQRAIRSDAVVDYVLKTEDEETVLHAVQKAVSRYEKDLRVQDLLKQAEKDSLLALPLLRKDFVMRILKFGAENTPDLSDRFHQLKFPLQVTQPVLLLLGQLNTENQSSAVSDLANFALENVMEKFMWPFFRWYSAQMDERRILFFLQTENAVGEKTLSYALSLLEAVQQTFAKSVGVVAFVIDKDFVPWECVHLRYRELNMTMNRHGVIAEDALLIQQDDCRPLEQTPYAALQNLRLLMERCDYLRAGEALKALPVPQTPSGRIDLYRHLIKLFSLNVEIREDAQAIYEKWTPPPPRLDLEGWRRTVTELAMLLPKLAQDAQRYELRLHQMAQKVKDYVNAHLDDDLTLDHMAELTHHSATYFTKLFKQSTGTGYGDYVVGCRMERAALLLTGSQEKVSEIARRVGYSSVSYFIRAFRKQHGMTPVEYRRMYQS
jgi:two-component system response regulator YesN